MFSARTSPTNRLLTLAALAAAAGSIPMNTHGMRLDAGTNDLGLFKSANGGHRGLGKKNHRAAMKLRRVKARRTR